MIVEHTKDSLRVEAVRLTQDWSTSRASSTNWATDHPTGLVYLEQRLAVICRASPPFTSSVFNQTSLVVQPPALRSLLLMGVSRMHKSRCSGRTVLLDKIIEIA